MPEVQGTKYCACCQQTKPLKEFYRDRSRPDGHMPACKVCVNWRNKDYLRRSGWKRRKDRRRDPKKVRADNAKYRQKYPEKCRQRMRAWYVANTEHVREYGRQRREMDPGRHAAEDSVYRERKRAAEGHYTPREWQDLCNEYGNCCAYCRRPRPLTRHHVVPLSKGGTNWISNILPACASCNSKIGTQIKWPWDPFAI